MHLISNQSTAANETSKHEATQCDIDTSTGNRSNIELYSINRVNVSYASIANNPTIKLMLACGSNHESSQIENKSIAMG